MIGIPAGIIALRLADRIIGYKCCQKNIENKRNLLSVRKWNFIFAGISTILWALAGLVIDKPYIALILALFFSMAIMISIIDLSIHIIPNELVLAMIALGVLFQLLYFDWKSLLIAIGCLLGLMGIFAGLAAIIGFDKVGAGDVKLAGAMGLVLGYPYILTAVFVMSVAMLVYCVIGIFIGKLSLVSMFPYGPFLMIGMAFGLLSIFFVI